MAGVQSVHYRLDSMEELRRFPDEDVVCLDWNADLEMIRRFYKKWGAGDDVDPPGPEEAEIGRPIAMVRSGEIVSFVGCFYFREGEAELGPVVTVPEARGKGYCHRVLSSAAKRVLADGLAATLTTGQDNPAMQAVAEAIGMRRVSPPKKAEN